MKKANYIYCFLLAVLCIILQSTLLQNIAVNGVVPDIALIVIVFSSNSLGAMRGQTLGFAAGLVQDFLSAGPIGFNAFIRTVTGFIYGKLKGKLFLDSILLPVIFVVTATLIKEVMISILSVVFIPSAGVNTFTRTFFIELGLNTFLSPFIFALMKLLKLYRINDKDGY